MKAMLAIFGVVAALALAHPAGAEEPVTESTALAPTTAAPVPATVVRAPLPAKKHPRGHPREPRTPREPRLPRVPAARPHATNPAPRPRKPSTTSTAPVSVTTTTSPGIFLSPPPLPAPTTTITHTTTTSTTIAVVQHAGVVDPPVRWSGRDIAIVSMLALVALVSFALAAWLRRQTS